MGAADMKEVSGKGYYKTAFSRYGEAGAYLSFVYQNDMVTAVILNGTEITMVNNVTDTLDIGNYMISDENNITIELSTTLNNRAKAESDTMRSLSIKPYGLKKVPLNPYIDTRL